MIEEIVEKIAKFFCVTKEDLLSRNKLSKISNTRNFCYYVLHCDYGYSISKIARFFGRTVRCVNYQIATIKYLTKNIKSYKKDYECLTYSIINALDTE